MAFGMQTELSSGSAGDDEDAALELDLGGTPAAFEGDLAEDPFSSPGDAPAFTTRPPSRPAMPSSAGLAGAKSVYVASGADTAPGARRGGGTGSKLQPYVPPNLARERRRLLIPVIAGVVVLALASAGLVIRSRLRSQAVESQLKIARAAVLEDSSSSLSQAEAAISEALIEEESNVEALALGAYVATRQSLSFDGGTDALIRAEERLSKAEAQPNLHAIARGARAMLLIKGGLLGEAIEVITTGLQETPGDPWLLWQRGVAERKLERLELAISTLQGAHARSPEVIAIAPTLALALQAHGDRDQAIAVLKRNLERSPTHLASMVLLMRMSRKQKGESEEVLARAKQLSKSLVTSASPTEFCRFQLAASKLALAAHRPLLAKHFEDGAMGAGAAYSCRIDLAHALWARGRYDDASEILASASEKLQEEDPSRAATLIEEATRAARLAGKQTRALGFSEQLPEGQKRELTRIWIELEGTTPDLAALTKSLAPMFRKGLRPTPAALLLNANLLLKQGKRQEAINNANQAMRSASSGAKIDAFFDLDLAATMLALGDPRKAALLLKRPAKTRHKKRDLRRLSLRGEAELLSGRGGAGLDDLEEALWLNPEDDRAYEVYRIFAKEQRRDSFAKKVSAVLAHSLSVDTLISEGRLLAATKGLERFFSAPGSSGQALAPAGTPGKATGAAEEENPQRLLILRALVKVLQSGDLEASNSLKSSTKLYPGDAFAARKLAQALLQLGRLGEAISAATVAARLGPYATEAVLLRVEAMALGGTPPDEALGAAKELEARLSTLPSTPTQRARAYAALALIDAEINDSQAALNAASRASQINSDDPRVLFARGRAAEASGNLGAAIRFYQEAGAMPFGELALLRLGILGADGLAEASLAKRSLERFLQLAPLHAQAARARALLASLP